MLFNSIDYLLFFPAVVLAYYLMPHRHRWKLLLAASYFFYMCWEPAYSLLLFFVTASSYVLGGRIAAEQGKTARKVLLAASFALCLAVLVAFKYFNFIATSINVVLPVFGLPVSLPSSSLLLPVGISFFTFQALSYCMDIYRGDKTPEKSFGIYALYVSFFPQLVAGPIERATRLLPQFHQRVRANGRDLSEGLQLICWGLFKKLVVADRLADYVTRVYNSPEHYTGTPLIVATYAFAFQIFCDFSGYSDMAIGSARILGIDLMKNFDVPYSAKSVAEFWKRWHISLSTWFRDYLYIPLGGSRVSPGRWQVNILAVFLISGLWHGANWTFVIWGGLHAAYIIIGRLTLPVRNRLYENFRLEKNSGVRNAVQILVTFHLVTFSWIFFRAESLSDALFIVSHLFDGLQVGAVFDLGAVAIAAILTLETVQWLQRRFDLKALLQKQTFALRLPAYYGLIMSIVLFGVFNKNAFIYFQF